jgi:hypothetical protein
VSTWYGAYQHHLYTGREILILLSLVYVPLVISSAVFLSMGSSLVTVGLSPSEQLLGHGFPFLHDGREDVGRARRGGKERDRTRDDQTEEGRKGGGQAVVLMSMGEEVPTLFKYLSVGSTRT